VLTTLSSIIILKSASSTAPKALSLSLQACLARIVLPIAKDAAMSEAATSVREATILPWLTTPRLEAYLIKLHSNAFLANRIATSAIWTETRLRKSSRHSPTLLLSNQCAERVLQDSSLMSRLTNACLTNALNLTSSSIKLLRGVITVLLDVRNARTPLPVRDASLA